MKYLLSIGLLTLFLNINAQTGSEAARLAQLQLDAYNAKDIDAFLAPYSDSVKVFSHPNQLILQGKEAMRERYIGRFANAPDLHCTLINRMVLGNVVIDQEDVIMDKNKPSSKVIAMYKIADGKIQEVYFIRPDQ